MFLKLNIFSTFEIWWMANSVIRTWSWTIKIHSYTRMLHVYEIIPTIWILRSSLDNESSYDLLLSKGKNFRLLNGMQPTKREDFWLYLVSKFVNQFNLGC